jgi:hypothetical protein
MHVCNHSGKIDRIIIFFSKEAKHNCKIRMDGV